MKQWCYACSRGEASSPQVCACEDLLLFVAVVVLAATHQADRYLLDLLQSVCRYFFVFFLGTQEVEPPPV